MNQLQSTRLFPKSLGASAYRITGIAARCDWVVLSDNRAPHAVLIRQAETAAPRHVYLSLRSPFQALRYFCTQVLPQIEGRFVLVSGSEDVTIPNQLDRRWRGFDPEERGMIAALLEDPRLIHWFAENLDAPHPLMSPLPLGMVWPEGPPDPVPALPQPPLLDPRPLRVFCAHRIRDGAQWDLRRRISELATGPWADFTTHASEELSEPAFLAEVETHSFVICGEGGGLDPSPKAWTAILHGAIPIIRDTPLAPAYRALPVAVVPDWTAGAITTVQLASWKAALTSAFDDPDQRAQVLERLLLDFWWQPIEKAGLAALTGTNEVEY